MTSTLISDSGKKYPEFHVLHHILTPPALLHFFAPSQTRRVPDNTKEDDSALYSPNKYLHA
jgi:hypothetical protein